MDSLIEQTDPKTGRKVFQYVDKEGRRGRIVSQKQHLISLKEQGKLLHVNVDNISFASKRKRSTSIVAPEHPESDTIGSCDARDDVIEDSNEHVKNSEICKCPFCSTDVAISLLPTHLSSSHTSSMFHCRASSSSSSVCHQQFLSVPQLRSHLYTQHSVTIFSPDELSMAGTIILPSDLRLYKCKKCPPNQGTFYGQERFAVHLASLHPEFSGSACSSQLEGYECRACDKYQLENETHLLKHIEQKHSRTPVPEVSLHITHLQDQIMEGVNVVNITTSTNHDKTMGRGHVDETMNSSYVGMNDGLIVTKTTADWLTELELNKVKKAGSFLDGCKVYLSGFSELEQMQLERVVKYSGAVRLTQLVEGVTHCVHSVDTNTVLPDTSKMLEQQELSPHISPVRATVNTAPRSRFYTF